MPVVIIESLITDGKIALEKTGQGLKKGQKEEKKMWAVSPLCVYFVQFL